MIVIAFESNFRLLHIHHLKNKYERLVNYCQALFLSFFSTTKTVTPITKRTGCCQAPFLTKIAEPNIHFDFHFGKTQEMQAFKQIGFSVSVGADDEVDSGRGMNVQTVQVPEMMERQAVDVHSGRVEFRWHPRIEREDEFRNFIPHGHSKFPCAI